MQNSSVGKPEGRCLLEHAVSEWDFIKIYHKMLFEAVEWISLVEDRLRW
jgi:hypothetical protein